MNKQNSPPYSINYEINKTERLGFPYKTCVCNPAVIKTFITVKHIR